MDLGGQTPEGGERLQSGMLEWAGRKGTYNGWLRGAATCMTC